MTFLSVRQIGKRYGATQALAAVDLDIAAGSRTAIVGPSGSGKSTLLRIVAGFEAPDEGQVLLSGQTLADGGMSVPAHRRDIGIVSQDGALFPHLNVFDNIGFGLDRKMPGRDTVILDLMDTVELPHTMRDRRPHELSGGQQQRVALARALARKPKLMLLDEPFSALDTGLRETMRKAVARVLQAAGITTLLVTHDQAEALSFADQVAVLRDGRLVQAGAPAHLYFHPKDRETASFLGDAIILPAALQLGTARCALGDVSCNERVSGRFDIMLRPEQLQLRHPDDGASACYGEIVDIDFRGSSCAVSLKLVDAGGASLHDAALTVRSSSLDAFERGMRVRILVTGNAHVLKDRDAI